MKALRHAPVILVLVLCSSALSAHADGGSRAQLVGFICEAVLEVHPSTDSFLQTLTLCLIDDDSEPMSATEVGSAASPTSTVSVQSVHRVLTMDAKPHHAPSPTPIRYNAAPPHTP